MGVEGDIIKEVQHSFSRATPHWVVDADLADEPVQPHRARRGRESKAEEKARALLKSQGLTVGVCDTCGHVAGTNEDCEECS